MRIDVRVKVPRLRAVSPGDKDALRTRLRAVRDMLGDASLPRTSQLRQAAAAMAEAGRQRGGR